MRPSTCGGNDAGSEESGMRCAGVIHRMVTSQQKTPNAIRSRFLNVVEMSILDSHFENWVQFNQSEILWNGVPRDENWERGYHIGYEVPTDVLTDVENSVFVGSG